MVQKRNRVNKQKPRDWPKQTVGQQVTYHLIGESRTCGTTKHNMIGVRTCSCICGNIRGYERIDDTISIVCF